jgi:hypothetical protein
MTEIYFPGRDYPDREVWLAKRCTHAIYGIGSAASSTVVRNR